MDLKKGGQYYRCLKFKTLEVVKMLIEFTDEELKKIRELLHKQILSQKPGKYTLSNKLAKKLDKLMEVTE